MKRSLVAGAFAVVLVAVASFLSSSVSPALASSACVSDPAGDAGGWNSETATARTEIADILEVCADYRASDLTFSLAAADPVDPSNDRSWMGGGRPAEIHFHVDTNDDGTYDASFVYSAPDGRLEVSQAGTGGCAGTARYENERYVAVVDPSCIGDPVRLRVAALFTYPDEPDITGSPVWYDFTELSEPVHRTSTERQTSRLAGPTRIETAVAISQRQFPGDAPVVYLANSATTVDAVAGGALTDGPVLLVPSCGALPSAVAAEIRRLNPQTVTALGGPAAVCEEMLAAAADA